ncbi:hypothetical protein Btru_049032 [Bulinus truncatus]|nr:hypothetical protein Btru_049032 [Bulinus truncatus]
MSDQLESSSPSGLKAAVSKLNQLGLHMSMSGHILNESDVNILQELIKDINDLENERKTMHDLLETETIKSSLLRYDLKVLPGQICDEVMKAVNSARQTNADSLEHLKNNLDNTYLYIKEFESKTEELEHQNTILQPEKELLHQQHEEIISQLNQKMADKAMMQIALNETRDKVRQANQDIEDIEDAILQLKEDLIQERTEARQEKKQLKKSVMETQQKTKEQKEQNIEKKKELDSLQELLMDSEGRLESLKKSIRRFETSKSKLESDEAALIIQLDKQLKMNEQERRRGAEIINESLREEQEFDSKERSLLKKLKTFKNDITKEMERSETLQQRKIQLQKDLVEKEKTKEEEDAYVAALDSRLQLAKTEVSEKAEEAGHMQAENNQMSEDLIELEESQKVVVTLLNNQIEECKDVLSNERGQRTELQQNKDQVSKVLLDMKTEQQHFMMTVTTAIQDGKKQHVQLSNEGVHLQKEILQDEEAIHSLHGKFTERLKDTTTSLNNLQETIDKYETEIKKMETEIAEKKETVSHMIPIFHDLEEYTQKRSDEYDKVKKSIVVLKNKRLALEDSIKRATKIREDLKLPQESLLKNLKNNHSLAIAQLKKQGENTKNIENEIFLLGCQIKIVMEENQKLENACLALGKDLEELKCKIEENMETKIEAEEELVNKKSELQKKWQDDAVMLEFFVSQSQVTVDSFDRVLQKSQKRENKIEKITHSLQTELDSLSDFLDTIIRPRQKCPSSKSIIR